VVVIRGVGMKFYSIFILNLARGVIFLSILVNCIVLTSNVAQIANPAKSHLPPFWMYFVLLAFIGFCFLLIKLINLRLRKLNKEV